MKKAMKILKISAVISLIACCLCMGGCGTDDIDISGYADREIVLSGIGEEDIAVTIEELKSMECKTLKTHSTSDKIGDVRATGVEMGTLLEKYNLTKEDVKSIRFSGADGYDVPMTNDYIKEHEIYLAFGIDGEPLEEDSIPCRVIIPESDSAYWIRMVTGIEFKL